MQETQSPIQTRAARLLGNLAALALVALMLVCALPKAALATTSGTDRIGSLTATERGCAIKQVPNVTCTYGILTDADGNVLWSRQPDAQTAMASITKVMTAILVLEDSSLTPQTMVTIGADAAATGESEVGLVAGTQVSVNDLLQGLLVHSGNDCAVALADAVSGSSDAFVAQMNAKAQELGMTSTKFATPSGLDENVDHHSTASDLVLMCRYAMSNETFRSIVAMTKCTVSNGQQQVSFDSTNELFGMLDGVEGIKTGYTSKAGNCLASAAVQNGLELYCVVLGCPTEKDRFTDSQTLLNWGFAHYKQMTLATAGTDAAEVALTDWIDRTVTAEIPQDVQASVFDFDGAVDQVVNIKDVSGDVKKGQVLGNVQWKQGDHVIATSSIVAAEDAKAPAWYEAFSIALRRGWAHVFGGQTQAESQSLLDPITITPATS